MLVLALLILLLLLANLPILKLPIFWDGVYWVNSAEWMSRNNLNPILPGIYTSGGLDVGHPPLVYLSLAVSFFLFGASPFAAHLSMLVLSLLALYFTYLLGSHLYGAKSGLIASLLLLFSPLFLAQSGSVSLDMGLVAFTVMAIYFALKDKKLLYWISGNLLVLSKEAGNATIIAVFVYTFIRDYKKPRKELIKNLAISLSPLLTYIAWMALHWTVQDQFAHPAFFNTISPLIILRLLNRIRVFFFNEYNWVLTLIVLISMCQLKDFKKFLTIKCIAIQLLTLASVFVFLTLLFNMAFKHESTLLNLINITAKSFHINGKDFHNILLSVYNLRVVFAIFATFLVFFWKNLRFGIFKNKEASPMLLTLLFYFLAFSWTVFMPRYFLALCPIFYIIGGKALNDLFKKKAFFVLIVILVFFIIQGKGSSSETKGYILERNMEYVDSVMTHQLMAEYIEENFPKATILTYRFMTAELRYPFLGYVKESISPIDLEHYKLKDKKTNFALQPDDWYYYQCYLKKQCDPSTQVPCDPSTRVQGKEGDIRDYDARYKEYLTPDNFDLLYYSPQATEKIDILKFIEEFNLTLVKRFERNGKYTELYSTEHFLTSLKKGAY